MCIPFSKCLHKGLHHNVLTGFDKENKSHDFLFASRVTQRGTSSITISCEYAKGDKFHESLFAFCDYAKFYDILFASLDKEALSKENLLLNKRICSNRSKFIHLRVDLH